MLIAAAGKDSWHTIGLHKEVGVCCGTERDERGRARRLYAPESGMRDAGTHRIEPDERMRLACETSAREREREREREGERGV